MRFATYGSTAVAVAASLASASSVSTPAERSLLNLDLSKDLGEPISASIDLGVDLSDTVLLAGVVAGVAVPPVVGVGADVEVAIVCDTCYTKGNIEASISFDKVVPALSLSLTDIEAKLDLDIKIGAAATIAVNLFAPVKPISLPLPGLKVEALVYLDLVLGVETAIDLSAGIEVQLVDEAFIETDIFAGKILDAAFSGLSVKVLPIEVRIGCTKLLADLRLRVELGVAAELDLDDIVPILDLPEIGAGLEVAVFANLLEYIGFFCATPECPLSKESYGLNIGAAVELDVSIEDLLSVHLAPTLSTALLSYPTATFCQHPTYSPVIPTVVPTLTASIPYGSSSTFPGSSSSGFVTATGSASYSASVSLTKPAIPTLPTLPSLPSLPTGSSGSASATVPGSPSSIETSSYGGPTGGASYPAGEVSTPAAGSVSTPAAGVSTPADGASTSAGASTPAVSATSDASSAITPAPIGGVITSTITNVQTFTVTACAANVPNCPAGYQTAQTVVHTTVYTTVCPATQTEAITSPPKPTHTKPVTPVTLTKTVVTLEPCSEVSSFTPPVNVPTPPFPTSPVAHTAPVTTPTGGSTNGPSSQAVPSPSALTPASSPSVGTPVGVPTPVGSPSTAAHLTTVPPYPTHPIGSNGTVPHTSLETSVQPSVSVHYPTASYPGETPIATAGAARVGSGIAGALAAAGAFVALM
ncbi:hypothetical protein GGS23DRAFT_439156 [Durotheca rogersii]|uniref:uncharacterized protein n=1 Tax=Durotheca rogersii TaxID=419775 RepID=UPI00221E7F58|nr:uncharacterized protein GGS23DRAFT_439156 [Durotheca rogersii]KAI5856173.1 hypothetical protein GGS23DRAFT_439156 [Durotheca rogersii]